MYAFIGFLLPPVIDVVNVRVANEKIRYLISMLICLMVAVIAKWNELLLGDVEGFLKSGGIIFAEAQTVYRMFWKKSEVREKMLKSIQ